MRMMNNVDHAKNRHACVPIKNRHQQHLSIKLECHTTS
jgi:hypothetical protein